MKRYVFLCQDGSVQDVGLLDSDRLELAINPIEDEPGIFGVTVSPKTSMAADVYANIGRDFTICKGEEHSLQLLQERIFGVIDRERHTMHVSVNVPALLREREPRQLPLKGMDP